MARYRVTFNRMVEEIEVFEVDLELDLDPGDYDLEELYEIALEGKHSRLLQEGETGGSELCLAGWEKAGRRP